MFIKWGVTGLIIEWEDCFPYKGALEVLNNKLYTLDDVTQIVDYAKEAKLEVIPLVQTFGHLEVNIHFINTKQQSLYSCCCFSPVCFEA